MATSKKIIETPTAIVIFGGSGDLTRRKLIPAFYNLYIGNFLPKKFRIILIGRTDDVDGSFKGTLLSGINEFSRTGEAKMETWKSFSNHLFYQQGDFNSEGTFVNVRTALESYDKENKKRSQRVFYLAIAPQFIETVVEGLYKCGSCSQQKFDRIVVEKPFGTDLETAQKLNKFLRKRFDEKQIFRIDHYLGKETVQNLMAFRFANFIFEPLWNRNYIEHIQISVAEEVSVGKRGGYYDSSGALRDMIQNHLLQLLCVTAMECPVKYEAETIRNAKVKVLKDIRPLTSSYVQKNIVRGQYSEGVVNGTKQVSYLDELGVTNKSTTETFVALKLFIDNERWKGVPFFLRTGKCLMKQASVISIQFKQTPNKIFKDDIIPNRLIISIQPEQEISLLFESKIPGVQMKLKPVEMDFTYKESYTEASPEAYEALLLDVIEGDTTLFMRNDQVEAAWKVVMPILDAWKKEPKKSLYHYKPGTRGPVAAKALLSPFAKDWILLSNASEKLH